MARPSVSLRRELFDRGVDGVDLRLEVGERLIHDGVDMRVHRLGRQSGGGELALEIEQQGYAWLEREPVPAGRPLPAN